MIEACTVDLSEDEVKILDRWQEKCQETAEEEGGPLDLYGDMIPMLYGVVVELYPTWPDILVTGSVGRLADHIVLTIRLAQAEPEGEA